MKRSVPVLKVVGRPVLCLALGLTIVRCEPAPGPRTPNTDVDVRQNPPSNTDVDVRQYPTFAESIAHEPPLIQAVMYGDFQECEALLDGGADPNVRDSDGAPALLLAIMEVGPESQARHSDADHETGQRIAEALLKHGADVNTTDRDGNAALYAAVFNSPKQVGFLLSHGANPNLQNAEGQSALHEAVKAEHVDDIRLMIRYHADPNLPDLDGHSPIDLALSGLSTPEIQAELVALLTRKSRRTD